MERIETLFEVLIEPILRTYFDVHGEYTMCSRMIMYEEGKLKHDLGKLFAGLSFNQLIIQRLSEKHFSVDIRLLAFVPKPNANGMYIINPDLTQIDPETYPYEERKLDNPSLYKQRFDLTPYLPLDLDDVFRDLLYLRQQVKHLQQENEILKAQILYQPMGDGFQEAKREFDSLCRAETLKSKCPK